MSKILRLFNTFTKELKSVELSGKLICARTSGNHDTKLVQGSLYICGPTVYSDSHLGHAITYARADLFRRVLKTLFNVRLTTVMNITDIDDKILAKAQAMYGAERKDSSGHKSGNKISASIQFSSNPSEHPFNKVCEKYYGAFLRDMDSIRVAPADLIVKISQQMPYIIDYIRKLERSGNAYLAANSDVYFNVNSLRNYKGRLDEGRSGDADPNKRDPRDFVLWKAAKLNEPIWLYESDVTGKTVPGRPGWHVQCSAIANLIFGSQLDFHFGGNDLVFPHHYNEEACCCAYHGLDTSESIHVWSKHWLHSGHLTLKDEKMSKSLGNVVTIGNFISRTSVNALRLLCISTHYRSNVAFSESLLSNLKLLDHKLSAFSSYLSNELKRVVESAGSADCVADAAAVELADNNIELDIQQTYDEFLEGACDDIDLDRGLQAILRLSQLVYARGSGNIAPASLALTWQLLTDWFDMCGLEYGNTGKTASLDGILLNLIEEQRHNVRHLVLSRLRDKQSSERDHRETLQSILIECDKVRAQLDEFGFVLRDKKVA